MSVLYQQCKHSPTEIEGESVCVDCGKVFGTVQVQSADDWKSHGVVFEPTQLNVVTLKICKRLNMPGYATDTAINTANKLKKQAKIPLKQCVLFAVVYSARVHMIARLLVDIFSEFERVTGGWERKSSENSFLRTLNFISKRASSHGFSIPPPDVNYYLKAYLAKIQPVIVRYADQGYFEFLRSRAERTAMSYKTPRNDPSLAAKNAIMDSMTSVLRAKLGGILV